MGRNRSADDDAEGVWQADGDVMKRNVENSQCLAGDGRPAAVTATARADAITKVVLEKGEGCPRGRGDSGGGCRRLMLLSAPRPRVNGAAAGGNFTSKEVCIIEQTALSAVVRIAVIVVVVIFGIPIFPSSGGGGGLRRRRLHASDGVEGGVSAHREGGDKVISAPRAAVASVG